MIDWSVGTYERTALALDDVSTTVVAEAAIGPDDTVLDIACGTGNAALKAAALGARVTGVDLAQRLVLVAGQRAKAAGLRARFVAGDAQSLPIQDDSVDVALSVFGLIFAPDQERTAAEVVRVLRPGGRALITGWVRAGALALTGAAMAKANAEVATRSPLPAVTGRTPVDWGEPTVVAELFAPHAVDLRTAEATVPFTAASPEAWVDDQVEHHPLYITTRKAVGEDRFRALVAELVAILHDANEDPAGFRITSRYTTTRIVKRTS